MLHAILLRNKVIECRKAIIICMYSSSGDQLCKGMKVLLFLFHLSVTVTLIFSITWQVSHTDTHKNIFIYDLNKFSDCIAHSFRNNWSVQTWVSKFLFRFIFEVKLINFNYILLSYSQKINKVCNNFLRSSIFNSNWKNRLKLFEKKREY